MSNATNRQLLENSLLNGSSVSDDYDENPDRLYNDRKPNLAIIHEKPEHRQVIFLKAEGYSNREIARITGYTEPWVSQILRQPWARQRQLEEIVRSGRDQVAAILEGAVVDSVFKVIEVRDTAERTSDQLSAATQLIDRYLGKPTQRVESMNQNMNVNLTGSLDEVNAQIARLEAEERKLSERI